MNYLEVANSPLMFALCGIVIAVVVVQAILFLRTALRRGKELGMEPALMKKAMTNAAIFSVIPSLPIIIMLMVLSVPLGEYFPWLRLSVVGSALYESMAADAVAKSFNLSGITDPGFTLPIFTTAMWVMTIGIVWGIIFNIFFMKSLDKFSKKAKESNNAFVPIFSAALFLGMMSIISTPYMVNTDRVVGIISFVCAAIGAMTCGSVAKATGIRAISEFSLPISLLIGMAAAVVFTQVTV
ncbi:MAG: DUF5058 family protein [Deferribacteraceae bacterium]|jgi:hypothetical protein|nr:DUF5058 family protein [Deferribacteraceae bacterium]